MEKILELVYLLAELFKFLNDTNISAIIKSKLPDLSHKEKPILRALHYEFSENIRILTDFYSANNKDKKKFINLINSLSIKILDGVFFNRQTTENEAYKYRLAYDKLEKSQKSSLNFIKLIESTRRNVINLKKDSENSKYLANLSKKRPEIRTKTLITQFSELKKIVEENFK